MVAKEIVLRKYLFVVCEREIVHASNTHTQPHHTEFTSKQILCLSTKREYEYQGKKHAAVSFSSKLWVVKTLLPAASVRHHALLLQSDE